MENGKYQKLVFGSFLLATLMLPVFSYAYSDKTTHPALTNETIDIFNHYYPESKLGDSDREKIIMGSEKEDSPIYRPLNHFYDPVYNVGLLNVNLSAKNWSQNTRAQAGLNIASVGILKDYFGANSDYSWDRAVYDYVYGDKNRSLEALGHNLHLIQDMSVPPHVRNDQHLLGLDDSPYEMFTKQFDKNSIKNLSDELIGGGQKPITKNNLNNYFDDLATLTNNNFFSKDTIFDKKYKIINIIKEEKKILSNKDEIWFEHAFLGKHLYKLDGYQKNYNIEKSVIEKEFLIKDWDNLILTDYWNILSKQSVLHGAGVIKLFFDDVEKEKQTHALYNLNRSFAEKVIEGLAKTGEGVAKSVYSTITNLGKDKTNNLAVAPNISENENTKSGNDVDNLVDNGLVDFSDEGQNDGVGEEVVDNSQPDSDDNSQENGNNLGNQDINQPYGEIENPILISNLTPNQSLINYSAGFGGGGSGGGSNENNQSGEENNQNNQDNAENQGQNDEKNENNITETINSPTITSPLNNQKFNQNSIEFYGTASSTNIIYSDFSNATTTADEEGQWSLVLEDFEQGTTTVNFFATNITQTATSSETSIEIFVDSQAPPTTLTVAECKDSLLKSDCLLAVTTVTINAEWSVDNSDFAYFILNKNGEKIETTATTTQIKINGNQDYRLAVSAVDDMGNVSEEAEQIIQINNAPVVINEIAWAGTSRTTSSDEWIELYNNTNEPIDLTGWTLYAEDKEPHIKLFGSIPANDYYLLERTDDTTVSDMQADLIYTGALSNSGEHLFLSFNKNNATTTVDEILKANNWGQNGNSVAYNTMERYDSHVAGTDWNNWGGATTRQYLINGKDANNESIFGTPKKRNSVNYLIDMSNELSVNKTLTKENSPYFIPEFSFKIKEEATLTIEEGAVIKFSPQGTPSFTVDGTIKSKGTKENPVVFTALYDDEYGGDMNNDGICEPENASSTSACPVAGSWRQIFVSEKSKDSVFENTIVRYGGHYLTGQAMKYKSMLTVENTDILINDSVFENSLSRGVYLINTGSDTEILGNIFRNNNYDETLGATYPYGLDVSDGAPLIENNLFENNGYGLHISGSSAVVNSNEFKNNFKNAILSSGPVRFYNNSGDGNKINGIVIGSDITEVGMTNIMKKNQLPYVLYDTGVNVVASSTLKLDPGVVIKFGNEKFVIEGSLEMGDLNGERVLFTSYVDNSDGTNVFGLEQPEEIGIGKWTGTYLEDGSISTIKNAEFRYMKYGLKYENSAINLENVMFKNNDQAIFADEGSFVQTAQNIIFEGNIATSTVPL